jgi:broad specificity phosphatase PhoE
MTDSSQKSVFLLLLIVLACTFEYSHSFLHYEFTVSNRKVACNRRVALEMTRNGDNDGKRIVLIRHGCTHMNEYLSKPGTRWGEPTFKDDWRFRDTTLSPLGVKQAKQLYEKFSPNPNGRDELHTLLTQEVDLVVVSPLKRALQTLEIGLFSHVRNSLINAPIIATPYASERVYLCSDIGSHLQELRQTYPFVDFQSGFHPTNHPPHEWWWTSKVKAEPEWRPNGQGQKYLNVGEPEHAFHSRMQNLHDWLHHREEQTIVLLSHWGVFQYLTGYDFQNCEVKIVPFNRLRKSGYDLTEEDETESKIIEQRFTE